MTRAAIAGILIATASVLAHLHGISQTYHPVVKVAAPDGFTYIAVLGTTAERPGCSAANRRFLEPMKAGCAECEIVFARCLRHLEGLELAVLEERPVPFPVLSAPGMRLAIASNSSGGSRAGAAQAESACDLIAGGAVRRGAGSASCSQAKW